MGAVMRYQPQGLIRASTSNPYGKRLIAAALPGGALYGTLRRASVVANGPMGQYTTGGPGSFVQSARPAQVLLGRQAGYPADNVNLSFVIVASNLGANSWIYDGQEAGGHGYIKTDGSGNLQYSSDAQQFTVALPASYKVIVISGNGYQTVGAKVWFDGVLGYTGTADTTGHWESTPPFRAFFGSYPYPNNNVFVGNGYMVAVLTGTLSDADAASLTANPWQLFDDPARAQSVTANSAISGVILSGSAVASASSTGSLATSIHFGSTIAAQATSSAALTTVIGLTGSTVAAATGSASLTSAIRLFGTTNAAASASASLVTQIHLAASVSSFATSSAALTTSNTLAGAATAGTTATAALTTVIRFAGTAQCSATSSASLTTSGGISATASAQASSSAALSTAIALAGVAIAQAQASASLSGQAAALSGSAQAQASGQAVLSTRIALVAIAYAQAQSFASLSAQAAGQLPDVTMDADLIPKGRWITFEGTGRVVTFEGDSRAIAFEGNGRVIAFEGNNRTVSYE